MAGGLGKISMSPEQYSAHLGRRTFAKDNLFPLPQPFSVHLKPKGSMYLCSILAAHIGVHMSTRRSRCILSLYIYI